MNPLIEDSATRDKLCASVLVLLRVLLGVLAWFCFERLGDRYVAPVSVSNSTSQRDFFILGTIIGATLMYKYFHDLIFVSRHGLDVARWFATGLRRPMQRFVPNLLGTFIGFHLGDVLQGKYWKLLTILPWTLVWIAVGAGISPVIGRWRKLRRVQVTRAESREIERIMRDEEEP